MLTAHHFHKVSYMHIPTFTKNTSNGRLQCFNSQCVQAAAICMHACITWWELSSRHSHATQTRGTRCDRGGTCAGTYTTPHSPPGELQVCRQGRVGDLVKIESNRHTHTQRQANSRGNWGPVCEVVQLCVCDARLHTRANFTPRLKALGQHSACPILTHTRPPPRSPNTALVTIFTSTQQARQQRHRQQAKYIQARAQVYTPTQLWHERQKRP